MKVYIVTAYYDEYENSYTQIIGVFDSIEKAEKCSIELSNNKLTSDEQEEFEKLRDILVDIENDVSNTIEYDNEEFDKEVYRRFENLGYNKEYYDCLENKYYSNYKFNLIKEFELE